MSIPTRDMILRVIDELNEPKPMFFPIGCWNDRQARRDDVIALLEKSRAKAAEEGV
jgi:hypothetical protein